LIHFQGVCRHLSATPEEEKFHFVKPSIKKEYFMINKEAAVGVNNKIKSRAITKVAITHSNFSKLMYQLYLNTS